MGTLGVESLPAWLTGMGRAMKVPSAIGSKMMGPILWVALGSPIAFIIKMLLVSVAVPVAAGLGLRA